MVSSTDVMTGFILTLVMRVVTLGLMTSTTPSLLRHSRLSCMERLQSTFRGTTLVDDEGDKLPCKLKRQKSEGNIPILLENETNVPLYIENKRTLALVDSGANFSSINQNFCTEHNVPILPH
jgi:hypothetical protein